jgi:hypothetical protein
MIERKRKRGADRTGHPNKSSALIKEMVQANVDFPKLIKRLSIRAMRSDTQAARILFEYGFGKAPQPLEHSGTVALTKFVEDLDE